MVTRIKTFWVLAHLGVLFCLCFSETNNQCKTPRNAPGECKVIDQCASLFSILEHRPIKPIDADYLSRSRTGCRRNPKEVCCPLEDNISLLRTTKFEQNISQPRTSESINLNYVGPVSSSLLPEDCGVSVEKRIIGGRQAGLSEFPWMALLEYENLFYCGGTLISNRYVLTAAHCIKGSLLNITGKLLSVRLGEYDFLNETDCQNQGFKEECAPPPIDVPIEEAIIPEQYNSRDKNRSYDIALLRLAKEVKFSRYVRPICLPKTADERSANLTGKNLTVAGWGKTGNSSASNVKLKVDVPVKTNDECNRIYEYEKINLKNGQLCAGGEEGKDSCAGDSGGPLMDYDSYDNKTDVSWYCVGIVSFGPAKCGTEELPAIYTRVASFMPWIVSKLRP